MNKHIVKRIVLCMITVMLTILLVDICARITQRKESRYNYDGLFKHRKDIDVLFVGTSHVVNGINPLDIYSEYGITTYNLGTHGSSQTVQYWTLVNALDYVNPKVVIIDCYSIHDSVKVYDSAYSWVHAALDAFPLSFHKIQAAIDITDEIDKTVGSAFDIAFDYNTYHNRWSQLEDEDFNPDDYVNKSMGAAMKMAYTPCYEQEYDRDLLLEYNTRNIEYLRRMVDVCESKGIKVVFTFLPCHFDEAINASANTAKQIADEYGIDYINFLEMPITNYGTDFADEGAHLNYLGARKISHYMGEHLADSGIVSDRRVNEHMEYWDEYIREYEAEKTDGLKNTDDALVYLMLLASGNYDVNIFIESDEILECYRYRELFGEFGITEETFPNANNIIIHGGDLEQIQYDHIEEADLPQDIKIVVYSESGEMVDSSDLEYIHANSGNEEDSYCILTHNSFE